MLCHASSSEANTYVITHSDPVVWALIVCDVIQSDGLKVQKQTYSSKVIQLTVM